eukprot:EG_transcript_30723
MQDWQMKLGNSDMKQRPTPQRRRSSAKEVGSAVSQHASSVRGGGAGGRVLKCQPGQKVRSWRLPATKKDGTSWDIDAKDDKDAEDGKDDHAWLALKVFWFMAFKQQNAHGGMLFKDATLR